MIERGSVLINCQPLNGLPNFFRVTTSNPATNRDDLDFVLNELESLAQQL